MDEKVVAQLRSINPNLRKQGMLALAKTGDKNALPWLKHIYLNDPEPVLREFAKQAALQIRARLEAAEEEAVAPPVPLKLPRLQGAERRRETRIDEDRQERSNLFWVGLVGLVVGGIFLWVLLGQQILRVADESSVQSRIASAPPLALTSRAQDSAGQGVLYHTEFENGAGFYLQEAQGSMPAQGWTLVVGVFTGNGLDALGWLTRSATENNWLLLAPYFPLDADGLYNAQGAEDNLARAMNFVTSNYGLNDAKVTAYGYGVGANLLVRYASENGTFRIVSLGELTAFPQMPNRRVTYLVMAAENSIADVTVEFMSRLGVLGVAVEGEVLRGIDDAELQNRQLSRTLELIKG
jgi:hypothetical protein